jgi:hypothetical protein
MASSEAASAFAPRLRAAPRPLLRRDAALPPSLVLVESGMLAPMEEMTCGVPFVLGHDPLAV